ncbi:MAG: hypothetical protein ACRD1R_14500 [Acidobacteriota bacterium]
MPRPRVKWRLEGGYSRFLEGSTVELEVQEGPLSQTLDFSPIKLARRSGPAEITLRASHALRGNLPGGLRWRIDPEGQIKSTLFFPGNRFFGWFPVPKNSIGIIWHVEANAEAFFGDRGSIPLLSLEGNTRLYHSWGTVFPEDVPLQDAFQEAWRAYLDPFDPREVYQMDERQVIRWRLNGRIRAQVDVGWGLGKVWTIPRDLPVAKIRREVMFWSNIGANFTIEEKGEFFIQVRKARNIYFRVSRLDEGRVKSSFSAGLHLNYPAHIKSLDFSEPEFLEPVMDELTRPALDWINEKVKEALVQRMDMTLSLERSNWSRNQALFQASWHKPSLDHFAETYQTLLRGQIPKPGLGVGITGKLADIRGRRVSIDFNVFNWIRVGRSKEQRVEHTVSLGPGGEIIVETGEVLEKTSYYWDEIQFVHLLYRLVEENNEESGVSFTWSFGREGRFSKKELTALLRMALRSSIIHTFTIVHARYFPLQVKLLLVTEFSGKGLEAIRKSDPGARWKALVRALEIAEPDRYWKGSNKKGTFWRDWIDYVKVRQLVDKDPVQSTLQSKYPIPGRSEFERIQVVTAYRKAKRFLELMGRWSVDDPEEVFKSFNLGMDMPIFVFFHLLCPSKLRRSGALMRGEMEDAWGDQGLLTFDQRLGKLTRP